ncbi:YihY/virulence factor BrkB family protein [Ramlibacter sp. PS4R-6]|uniref:YihY/virulence factor BrkB family protein n=1 Tax=Ramlibacter sp. PS4R-6 TaxID=3133438 RepID=UPI0030964229
MKLPLHPKHVFKLFIQAVKAWSDDYAPSMGAAIAYYTVFSLAPLLVIVIAIAGAVFGQEAVSGAIVGQLSGLIGEQGAVVIQKLVEASALSDKSGIASVISGFVLVIGATTVFAELQNALDRIWHVPPAQKPKGIWALLRARIMSFGLIIGLVFLLMVSLAVSAAVAALGSFTYTLLPGQEVLLLVINEAVAVGIFTAMFAMIYKLMPSTPIAWRDVWVGSFTTAVMFEVGKFLIGLYLGKSSMTETFAAAGSLVILLAWVYYAAQIFLLGAEFTKLHAQHNGSTEASRAMDRTKATAAIGIPTEGPAGSNQLPQGAVAKIAETQRSIERNEPPRDPAMEAPVFRATEVGLKAALAGLYTEIAALVVVTIAGSVIHRKRQKLQDGMRLAMKDTRRQSKRRLAL